MLFTLNVGGEAYIVGAPTKGEAIAKLLPALKEYHRGNPESMHSIEYALDRFGLRVHDDVIKVQYHESILRSKAGVPSIIDFEVPKPLDNS